MNKSMFISPSPNQGVQELGTKMSRNQPDLLSGFKVCRLQTNILLKLKAHSAKWKIIAILILVQRVTIITTRKRKFVHLSLSISRFLLL